MTATTVRMERRYEPVVSRGRQVYRVWRGERLIGAVGREQRGALWEICTPAGDVVPALFDMRHQAADALEALA